ncbi:MAG: hypothetical protein IJX68_04005 [Rikenellaceae bacterium]|nr:hypothetical protein [Rikenellaceae bacterium]
MKRFFLCIVAMAAMFVGCENDPAGIKDAQNEPAFSATFDAEETRVYLGEDNYYRWEAGDKVSVFAFDDRNRMYEAEDSDVILTDLLFVSKPDAPTGSITPSVWDRHYAVFPYSTANHLAFVNGAFYSVVAQLEAEQVHDASKAGLDYAIMTSTIPSMDKVFHFKNSCALIKVNVRTTAAWNDEFYLNSIKVDSKNNYLAGRVVVDAGNDDFTAKIYQDGTETKSITLSGCEEVGKMTPEYKTFIIAIPAGTYAADDLTLSFDCSNDAFDCDVTVPTGYEVARSKYMEFNVTLDLNFDGTFDWYEELTEGTKETIMIKSPMKINKALIADIENLKWQGFPYQYDFDYIFEVPAREVTEFVVNGHGLKHYDPSASNVKGNKITFYTEDRGEGEFPVFVVNNFTTLSSGITEATPAKVTVNNLVIAGKLRTTTMGIYVLGTSIAVDKDTYPNYSWPTGALKGEHSDQTQFDTEWNEVIVEDNKIIPYLGKGADVPGKTGLGTAVACYGKAVLNKCTVTGTVGAEEIELREDLQGIPLYDLAAVNGSNVTINGGEIGKIYGWAQSDFTFTGGANIDRIDWHGIYIKNYDNSITVDDAIVGTINAIGNSSYSANNAYASKIVIKANSTVDTLQFGEAFTNFSRVTIEEGATVGTVILVGRGTDGADLEMTLAEFKANYLN